MKSNLHKSFKTDKAHEEAGVWFEINEGQAFRLKRFGGWNSQNVKKELAIHHKPYAKLIQKNRLPEEKERRIMTTVFVNACMVDWKGIEIDGEEKEFNKDLAIELLIELPDLAQILIEHSTDEDYYLEDLGKS